MTGNLVRVVGHLKRAVKSFEVKMRFLLFVLIRHGEICCWIAFVVYLRFLFLSSTDLALCFFI